MALNDAATLVINAGNFYTAPTGTAVPADLLAPGDPWVNVGNTSLEDILSITSEGGDKTVLGTLQNKSLRTKYSDRQETFSFTLEQFDVDSLKLYFGSNMVDINSDESLMGVPLTPTPTQGAFLAVFVDGSNHFAFYAAKSELLRGDDLDLSDTESVAGLPISVTPLATSGNQWAYAVTPIAANES